MFDFLNNETIRFALLGISAAIAIICIIITLIKENHEVEKIEENRLANEELYDDYSGNSDNCNYIQTADFEEEFSVTDENQQTEEISITESTFSKKDAKKAEKEAAKEFKKYVKEKQNKTEIAVPAESVVEVAEENKISKKDSKKLLKEEKKASKNEITAEIIAETELNNEKSVVTAPPAPLPAKVSKKSKQAEVLQEELEEVAPITIEPLVTEAVVAPVAQKVAKLTEQKVIMEEASPVVQIVAKDTTKNVAKETTTKSAEKAVPNATTVKEAKAPANKVATEKEVVSEDDIEAKIYGKYLIKEVADEDFQFELYNNKGKLLFQSVSYSSMAICTKNIGYFKKNVLLGAFSVEGGSNTGYRFVLTRGVVTYVGVAQKTRAAADNAIQAVKDFSQTDVIK